MKKLFAILFALLLLLCLASIPMITLAEGEAAPAQQITVADEPRTPETPFTWAYLATIAGATAATLLIVQFLKLPLDKVWKIPTRIVAYLIALILMLVATIFTTGLTVQDALLAAVNAFIVALAAYGSYELTFAKFDRLN